MKHEENNERYPNLHAVPTERLASNIVGSLIMQKGNLNRYKALLERLFIDYRVEEEATLMKVVSEERQALREIVERVYEEGSYCDGSAGTIEGQMTRAILAALDARSNEASIEGKKIQDGETLP